MISNYLMFILLGTLNPADPWYEQKMQGWYYFEEEGEQKALTCDSEEAQELLEEEKQRLNALLASAVLFPTPENVEQYKKEHDRWHAQSSQFANTWQEVEKRGVEEDICQTLSDRYFLLFCFKGKDPISKTAAESAKAFCERHGWKLKALSLDGVGIEGIDYEIDQGMSVKLNVETAPSFYAIDPVEQHVVHLSTRSFSL